MVLALAAIGALGAFQGCASPPGMVAATPVTKAYLSLADIRRITPGMSISKTEDILGKPLNVVDLQQRHDYMVKVTEDDKTRFVPYGVFFKGGVVVKVEALDK